MNRKERKEIARLLDHIEEKTRAIRAMIQQDEEVKGDINEKCIYELKKYLRNIRFDTSNLIPVIRKYHETSSKRSALSIAYRYVKYMLDNGMVRVIGTDNGRTLYELT